MHIPTNNTITPTTQVAWLREDLAAVDRSKTPWVIAMSHFPFYLAATPLGAETDTAAEMAVS